MDASLAIAEHQPDGCSTTTTSPHRRKLFLPIGWEVFDALVPAFATRGLSHEERIKAKQRYKAWQEAYDECRRRFLEGEPNLLWPAGTWAMVEYFGQKADSPLS
ncbi:MAG: hypothetical protein AAF645_13160 [Myxococcota bacterium]